MTISTASAKQKGRKAQQLVRDAVLAAFPALAPEDVVSCPMGSNGSDLMLSAEARRQFPFSVEVKARAKIALVYDALAQAERGDGLTPVAVIKADRKQPLVVLSLEDFVKLVKP